MNRLFRFAIVALVATFTTLSANAKIIGLGVIGGTTHTNYSIEGYDDAISNNVGWQAGVSVSTQIPIVSISAEAMYMQNKFDIDSSVFGSKCSVTNKAIYLPVVVGYSVFGPLKIEAGPTFYVYDSTKASFSSPELDLDLGSFHPSVGYVAGVKLSILGKITLGARYSGSFGQCESNLGGVSTYNVNSSSYSFSIGYKL